MKIAIAAIMLLLIGSQVFDSISEGRKCDATGGTYVRYGRQNFCVRKGKHMPWE
jgi:hypothetical protein